MGSKFKAGKAEAIFSDDLQSFYTGFLDKVAPGARKIIDDTLQEIEQEAQKNWPKRQPIIRRKMIKPAKTKAMCVVLDMENPSSLFA